MSHIKNGISKLSKHTLVRIEKHRQAAEKILDFITPEMNRTAEILDGIHLILQAPNRIRGKVKSIIPLNIKNIMEIASRVYSLVSPNYLDLFEMANKIQAIIPNNKVELEKTLQELAIESLKGFLEEENKDTSNKDYTDNEIVLQKFASEIRRMELAGEFREIYNDYPDLKINLNDKEKIVTIKRVVLIISICASILSPYSKYMDKILALYAAYDNLNSKLVKEEA